MKALELSQRTLAVVDDDVYDWLHHWNWSITKVSPKLRYARRLMVHPTLSKQVFVYLHKIIAGVNSDFTVKFRDGNPLNIQRENLCILDGRKNEITWDGSRCESLFKGVQWDKYQGLWRAHIKGLTIGHFVTEFDAAISYNEKAREFFGPGAEVNNMEAVCQRR